MKKWQLAIGLGFVFLIGVATVAVVRQKLDGTSLRQK